MSLITVSFHPLSAVEPPLQYPYCLLLAWYYPDHLNVFHRLLLLILRSRAWLHTRAPRAGAQFVII